jgi:hypothetical protein
MNDLASYARAASKSRRQRPARPVLEGLEDRMLLYSVTGDHFVDGSRITWSLMPDGTNLGGIPSNFFGTMNADFGPGNWESAIDDAFAQWENVTNVNFAQVLDDGSPFDSGPYQQGSPEFGDIRIGGMVQAGNILAFTMLPPGANGGSDSGDILFNTAQPWHIGSSYDLETVMLHEIGHALGMGHSTNPTAAMYPYYGGVQDTLSSDDIAGVDSIWGPRQEDPFVQNFNNLTLANAASVNGWLNTTNNQINLPGLDVASSSQAYWFKVTTPANASNVFTVQVQSTNLSELSPRVVIDNAAGVGLTQAIASPTSYGATIDATITNATPNTTYDIKVLGSNAGETGTGGYALAINMGSQAIPYASPPNTTVLAQPDQGGGADLLTVGGVGTLTKQLALAAENLGFLPLETQAESALAATLQSVADDLAASGSLTGVQVDAALNSLFQEIPAAGIDAPLIALIQSSTEAGLERISMNGLETILGTFLGDIQAILAAETASNPSGS